MSSSHIHLVASALWPVARAPLCLSRSIFTARRMADTGWALGGPHAARYGAVQ